MYFDITMPATLFAVTLLAVFLNGKIEGKLKATFEEREFGVRDVIMLVAAISVTVSVVVLVPQMAVLAIFLFAYSMLLFVFTYVFSDFKKEKALLFHGVFSVISFLIATFSIFSFGLSNVFAYGALAFYCLWGFSFAALIYEKSRKQTTERWYLAVLPPAFFVILYVFYSGTSLWFPYLLNMYGAVFAVLIILYLGSLFNWRTTLIFAGLLTAVDIFLVLVTGTMVSAATHVSELRLPVLITLPTIPNIITSGGVLYMSLGLGDFFFAGLIALQTLKKFGKKIAVGAAAMMALSFFIFETLILNFELRAFPGTLMIICGWLPVIIYKFLRENKSTHRQTGIS